MKNLKFISFVIFAFIALSCKKEKAVTTDSINPMVKLRVFGNGVDKIFYGDSATLYDSGHLYLNPNVVYNFTLAVGDTGGVSLLQINIDTMAFRTQNLIPIPAPLNDTFITPNSLLFSINGNSNNPYTNFFLSGKLTPKSDAIETVTYFLQCKGSDYTPNIVPLNIPCIIHAQSPVGYGWIE